MASGRSQYKNRDDGGYRGDLSQGPGNGVTKVSGQKRAFVSGTSDVRKQAMPSGSKKTSPGK
jgi:hypothetical protein